VKDTIIENDTGICHGVFTDEFTNANQEVDLSKNGPI
jgi:hypothetical protein